MIEVPVSTGEVIDKITILQIKQERIADAAKHKNVTKELNQLLSRIDVSEIAQFVELKKVNEQLWDVEDAIRVCEKKGQFDDEFVRLARSVYILNDQRAELKKQINLETGSRLIEEKSYEKSDI
jgi:hypothetical protein